MCASLLPLLSAAQVEGGSVQGTLVLEVLDNDLVFCSIATCAARGRSSRALPLPLLVSLPAIVIRLAVAPLPAPMPCP